MNPIFEYQKTPSGNRAFLRGPPELLIMLPPPDPMGVALAEVKKNVWVVKENDCQSFTNPEAAAFFYLNTDLATPALRALIPIRAADDTTACFWPKRLSQEQAQSVYDILARLLGAPEARRKEFYTTFIGADSLTTWEFETWRGHRFTFEYNGRPDFRGDPMTASQFSSLLLSHTLFALRALFRDARAEPVKLPTPAMLAKQPKLKQRPEIKTAFTPRPPVSPPPVLPPSPPPIAKEPEKPILEVVKPVFKKKPEKQRPVISMTSLPKRVLTEVLTKPEEPEEFPDMTSLLGKV